MTDQVLEAIQLDMYRRTLSDAFYFSDITVLNATKGLLTSEIEQQLGLIKGASGGRGTCVIIMQPIANVAIPNTPASPLRIQLTAKVLEEPQLNMTARGTQKPALRTARRIVHLWHGYEPFKLCNGVLGEAPTIVPVSDDIAPVAYEVRFWTRESEKSTYLKCGLPVISASGLTVTIAVPSGCAVWFSTGDGPATLYPYEGGSDSGQYSVPFTLNAAATVRAVAYRTADGYLPSDAASLAVS